MKKLAACLTCLACSVVATSLFAQGQINWNNTAQTLISVNGSPMPARTNSASTYYFGLFIAPLGTPPPASGFGGVDDPNWQNVVAYATNHTTAAGRINPGTATVIGYAAETNVNFIVRGWQSTTGGADWWYAKQGVTVLGTSAVGTATLGGGAQPFPFAFGPSPGQISGFNVGAGCLECAPPGFSMHPSNVVASVGSDVAFTSYAGYMHYVGPPVGWEWRQARYQWRKQASPIAGATNSYLVLTNVGLSSAGNYDVVATGSYGSALSAVATLTVYIPGIAATLGSPAYTANNQFHFTVTGSEGSNYVVQVATNLAAPTTWVSLFTNASPFTFVDYNAPTFPQRFYRALAR